MGQAALNLPLSAADFLAWDATQTTRHEFVRGEVFAMAGAGERHVTVALNVAMALRQHLAGTPCRTFITDLKLRVEAADAFFYPDVMVTCSPRDAEQSHVKSEPVLLVEVLSPATAAFDRGDKFAAYRGLPSLKEVLLVDPDLRRCDLFRRQVVDGGEAWVLHPGEAGAGVELVSVGLALSAAALWAEVPVLAAPRASGA
ncbi:MAG: Uma2 family endonuclease [Betaproteobacteria bacterium]